MNIVAKLFAVVVALAMLLESPLARAQQPFPGARDSNLAGQVEERLRKEEGFLGTHAGYVRYLADHPDVAAAKKTYWDLMGMATFRSETLGFEEALREDTAAEKLANDYYRALAGDEELRRRVDALHRAEFRYAGLLRRYLPAMRYLKAHPDDALAFLGKPAFFRPVPDSLRELERCFRDTPAAQTALFEAFDALHKLPQAHTKVFPWWHVVYGETGPMAEAYARLEARFASRSAQFWAWTRANTTLADHPGAAPWIRCWRARVLREPDLGDLYGRYMRGVFEDPLEFDAALQATADEAPASWPPPGSPPRLPHRDTLEGAKPERPSREDIAPKPFQRPKRPARAPFKMPQLPDRPSRPTVPTKPSADAVR